MYDTAFRYMEASNLSIARGKVHEQLYNYILKEETLPCCIHCYFYGHCTLSCSTRSKPSQSYRSPLDHSPLPSLKHRTRLPSPLSHHLPRTCSPQPSAVSSTVAAAAAPTVNSCTSATSQTVRTPPWCPVSQRYSSLPPPQLLYAPHHCLSALHTLLWTKASPGETVCC